MALLTVPPKEVESEVTRHESSPVFRLILGRSFICGPSVEEEDVFPEWSGGGPLRDESASVGLFTRVCPRVSVDFVRF